MDSFFNEFLHKINNDSTYRSAYFYILGQYLGDGCINEMKNKRTHVLRIACADKYPKIIEEVKNCLGLVFPNNKVQNVQSRGCKLIGIYNCNLPLIFPQHGSGKKHNRKIELSDWQEKFINYEQLIKGLFHSDGHLHIGNELVKNKNRISYSFTNCSRDIIEIYSKGLDSLNIKYRIRDKKDNRNKTKAYIVDTAIKNESLKLMDIIGIKE